MSRRNSSFSEHAPLMRASSQPISIKSGPSYHHIPHPSFSRKLVNGYRKSRTSVKSFLSSGAQHYAVLLLVACDLICIFADIIINLYQCDNDKEGKTDPIWNEVRDGLGIAGLIFSCLFMVELMASVWAFGWRYVFSTLSLYCSNTRYIRRRSREIIMRCELEESNKLLVEKPEYPHYSQDRLSAVIGPGHQFLITYQHSWIALKLPCCLSSTPPMDVWIHETHFNRQNRGLKDCSESCMILLK